MNIPVLMIGCLQGWRVEFLGLDMDNQILTITLPKDSFLYHEADNINSPDYLAKRIKDMMYDLKIFDNGKVRYKIIDKYWSKEDEAIAIKNFKKDYKISLFS